MVTNKENVESKAIVLNSFNIKENTRILKIFSYEYGRIDLIVQGVRKIGNDKISVDILSEIFVNIAMYKDYSYLLDYELLRSNYKIRNNNDNIIFGNLVVEIIQTVFPLNYPDKRIYDLIEKYLRELNNENSNSYILSISLILKFLTYMGYKPNISSCVICNDKKSTIYYYSSNDASIICSKHAESSYNYKLELSQIKLLNKLLYSKLEEARDIKYKDNYYLLSILIETVENLFGLTKLNSHKYINNMRRWLYD